MSTKKNTHTIADVQAMRIIDRRYNKIVTNYDELRPQDYK